MQYGGTFCPKIPTGDEITDSLYQMIFDWLKVLLSYATHLIFSNFDVNQTSVYVTCVGVWGCDYRYQNAYIHGDLHCCYFPPCPQSPSSAAQLPLPPPSPTCLPRPAALVDASDELVWSKSKYMSTFSLCKSKLQPGNVNKAMENHCRTIFICVS